jgi:hypothetical protein
MNRSTISRVSAPRIASGGTLSVVYVTRLRLLSQKCLKMWDGVKVKFFVCRTCTAWLRRSWLSMHSDTNVSGINL